MLTFPDSIRCLALALAIGLLTSTVWGQDGRPQPQPPVSQADNGNNGADDEDNDADDAGDAEEADADEQAADQDQSQPEGDDDEPGVTRFGPEDLPGNGQPIRRSQSDEMVKLAFNDVSIDQTFAFIVEVTGKVVMPVNLNSLRNKRITLVNDEFITREQALDMLFTAFRLNDVGVIEKDDVIIINDILQVVRTGDLPVLDPSVDVLSRTDRGTIVIKIFSVVNANAQGIGDRIMETLPEYATLTVDPNSNQIVVLGDIALCQQVQRMITELDNNYIDIVTQTYRLAHADASEVADNIYDLFEDGGAIPIIAEGQQATRPQRGQRRGASNVQGSPASTGPIVQPRLTVNIPQNTVTVQAERKMVQEIGQLISYEWDLPRPLGTSKVYELSYTDPVKMRDILRQVLGQDADVPGRTGGSRGGAAGGNGPSNVSQIVSGVYQIEAFPDTQSLLVLAKTEETLGFLDHLVEQLDQPSNAGLPIVIELKHANAVNLAEELNALLQQGGQASIPRPETGLSGRSLGDEGTGGGTTGGQNQGGGQGGEIQFPWQERTPELGQSPESPLIGHARIVPIVRQNALAILAPIAKQEAIRDLVDYFDRPGRQVMISAVIAEVTLADALSLGLRLSSSEEIGSANPDFGFGASGGVEASEEDILGGLFTSSVLDVNFNINAFFQALNRTDSVRVLQQPRVFTSDNQEAQFFDGQEVPIISDVLVTDVGGVRESFDRVEVGVRLNVRPRITVNGDVDMEVVLELSSVVPGTSGSTIVIERRETTTQIIVRDGQTIVLSGILREQESEIRRKFPILGDIPLLNLIFSSNETEVSQSELIAFITPVVVDNPSDNDDNFNVQERERLREISQPIDSQNKEADRVRDRIVDPEEQSDGDDDSQ